jgi:methyl-accepting chemotaxis protein
MSFKIRSVKQRIIGYFLAILAVVVITIIASTVMKIRQSYYNFQNNKARVITTDIAIACSGPLRALIMGDLMVSDDNSDKLTPIIAGIKSSDHDVEYCVLLESDGRVIASSNDELKGKTLDNTDFEKEALAAKEILVHNDSLSRGTFEMAAPVVAAGKVLGILRIGFTTKYISALANEIIILLVLIGVVALIGGSIIYGMVIERYIIRPLSRVMDVARRIADGNILQNEIEITSDDEIGQLASIFNGMLRGLSAILRRAELIASGVIGASEAEDRLGRGLSLEIAVRGEQVRGDLAVAFENMQVALRKLTIQARRIAVGDLNSPLLDLQIPGELGDAFSRMTIHLKELSAVARMIADNDLTKKITVNSEKDVLRNAFHKMIVNLKGIVGSVNRLASETHGSASDIAGAIEQSNRSMAEVQNSIQQISTATVQISKSIQQVAVFAQGAQKVADNGGQNVDQVINRFNSVEGAIGVTGKLIQKLEQRSREISKIVGLITDIAEQTNLLALNAAIEAARAGESGRGFAVVADEVRRLAGSSGQSANSISKIIKEIREDTVGVVKSSQVSLEEAKGVLSLADKMRGSYKEIIDVIYEMRHEIEHIAAVSEETASSSEEITPISEEQTHSMAAIAQNVHGLVEQAAKVKNEIEIFKI